MKRDAIKTDQNDAIILSSDNEKDLAKSFTHALKKTLITEDELLANLGLFLTSKNLSRILFFYEIYRKILNTHGVIMEFGVRWGQNLSLLSAMRGILEPFNRHRKIIGFDTFSGFIGLTDKDGEKNKCVDGSFSVPDEYQNYLEHILALQEKLNPLSHIKRFELVEGNAIDTIHAYFEKHPETIVSLAILDFDI